MFGEWGDFLSFFLLEDTWSVMSGQEYVLSFFLGYYI